MSDLNYLFRQSKIKQTTPAKRLFQDQRSRYRPKQKPIVKTSTNIFTNSHHFPVEQLSKRYLSKQNLKKQLNAYNSQMLLTLLRKIFFFMVAIITLNMLATGTDQTIICANLALGLALLDLHIGWDFLGSFWFRSAHLLVRFAAYCLNFQLIFTFILKNDNESISSKAQLIVAVNAGLNYVLLMFLKPLLTLRTIQNRHTPYMSFFQTVSTQLNIYLASFKSVYFLFRPILLLNLAYFLLIILFIMKTQDEILFYELFSLLCLRALIATTIVLHIYLFVLKLIDRSLAIELIASNKKEINLNLLRLDEENKNNRDVLREIERYIWASSENFWDMQFLAHRYNIVSLVNRQNYDLIENHMLRTLSSLQKEVQRLSSKSASSLISQKGIKLSLSVFPKLFRLILTLQRKSYIFFIIDQIVSFSKMGTSAPIHMDLIIKSLRNLNKTLNYLQQGISILQIKKCIVCLLRYLQNIAKQYQ